jgi:DNA polymerase-3 subunit delta'
MIKHAIETQKPILDMLIKSRDNRRLSHAYLFSGEEGSERMGVALYFACMLYCNDVCLECKECKDIINNNHLNVMVIDKLPGKSEIVKEQIENLKEELSKTSLKDGPRIYIINDAENMNSTCANKLLKFIEEPYDDIYAILLTTNKDAILQTIRSRCQMINLLPMNKEELKENLINEGMDNENASILSSIYNSVPSCKKALDLEIYTKSKNTVRTILEMISKRFPNTTMYLKNDMEYFSSKENIDMFLKIMLLYFLEAKKKSNKIFVNDLDLFNKIDINLTPIIDLIIKSQFNLRYNIDRNLLLLNLVVNIDRSVLNAGS